MSVLIVAWCTRSLGRLGVGEVAEVAEDFDFAVLADLQGLEEDAGHAARKALRLEGGVNAFQPGSHLLLHYEPHGRFIRVDRQPRRVAREAAAELLDGWVLPGQVTGVLEQAVEQVTFTLNRHDEETMGWPIAWRLAMWFAERGDGVVSAEPEWWDPATYEPIGD